MVKTLLHSSKNSATTTTTFKLKPFLVASMIKPDQLVLSEGQYNYCYQKKEDVEIQLAILTSLLADDTSDLGNTLQLIKNKHNIETPFHFLLSQEQHETLKAIQGQRRLIKSLRWDASCFFNDFILGITPSEKKRHYQILRPLSHKPYTVFADGAYAYSEKPSPYPQRKLDLKKSKRSQHQSTSLVSHELQLRVFGLNSNRQSKLVGVIIDADDALVNRYFCYDSGTVKRPYEHYTIKEAQRYHKRITRPDKPRLFADRDTFEAVLKKSMDKHNEVLARIRWNVNSSAIGIFNDTFEARAISHYYAEQIYLRVREQYDESGLGWDEQYQVPIIYYLSNDEKNWTQYADKEKKEDKQIAQGIYENHIQREEMIAQNNGEFLLLLDNPESVWVDLLKDKSLPLFTMLNQNQFQLVEALYQRTGLTPSLDEALTSYAQTLKYKIDVNSLLKKELILKAAECRKPSILKFALNLGLSKETINRANRVGMNALHMAARNGDLDAVKALLKVEGLDVNKISEKNIAPLHYALRCGHIEVIKAFLKVEAIDVNITKDNGISPLFIAARSRNLAAVKALIRAKGIDVNKSNHEGTTPLILAACIGRLDIVNVLLKADEVDLNQTNHHDQSALSIAIRKKHIDIIKVLLKAEGIKVNQARKNKRTPLVSAARQENFSAINVLVHADGIDIKKAIKQLSHSSQRDTTASIIIYLKQCIKHPKLKDNPYRLALYALEDYIKTRKKPTAMVKGFFHCNKSHQAIHEIIELLNHAPYKDQEWDQDVLRRFFQDVSQTITPGTIHRKDKLAAILKIPTLFIENDSEDMSNSSENGA